MQNPLNPVVVGVVDHPASRIALDWAIDEASRRRLPLRLLSARPSGDVAGTVVDEDGERAAQAMALLEAAARRAHSLDPGLEVTTDSPAADPADALLTAGEQADCVVVGARARLSFVHLLLGSTSREVARRSGCPVVVVRELPTVTEARPSVVVGSDGSPVSSEAIGYAFAQASARELPLTVVHAWSPELVGTALDVPRFEQRRRSIADEERAVAAESVAGWSEKYPDVTVRLHVLRASPAAALIDHSRGADLLVVGSHGRTALRAALLGSVSQAALQGAHCPVAVVHPTPDHDLRHTPPRRETR